MAPTGKPNDPIPILTDSGEESEDQAPPPISYPLGTIKRPISLVSDSDDTKPPKKKKKKKKKKKTKKTANDREQQPLNVTLAIPARPYRHAQRPELLDRFPAAAATAPEPNFVVPTIEKSARVTALLRSFPPTPLVPLLIPAAEQRREEQALAANRQATESDRGEYFAWLSFAHASRRGREDMVRSGLEEEEEEDLDKEEQGLENGLPEWKRPHTGLWREHGSPRARETPDREEEEVSEERSDRKEGGEEEEDDGDEEEDDADDELGNDTTEGPSHRTTTIYIYT